MSSGSEEFDEQSVGSLSEDEVQEEVSGAEDEEQDEGVSGSEDEEEDEEQDEEQDEEEDEEALESEDGEEDSGSQNEDSEDDNDNIKNDEYTGSENFTIYTDNKIMTTDDLKHITEFMELKERVLNNLENHYKDFNGRNLFVRFPGQLPNDYAKLEATLTSLCDLIIGVRPLTTPQCCLVYFKDSDDCLKGFAVLSTAEIDGKKLTVSSTKPENAGHLKALAHTHALTVIKRNSGSSVIIVRDIPKTEESEISKLFPGAVDISFTSTAVVKMPTAVDASAAMLAAKAKLGDDTKLKLYFMQSAGISEKSKKDMAKDRNPTYNPRNFKYPPHKTRPTRPFIRQQHPRGFYHNKRPRGFGTYRSPVTKQSNNVNPKPQPNLKPNPNQKNVSAIKSDGSGKVKPIVKPVKTNLNPNAKNVKPPVNNKTLKPQQNKKPFPTNKKPTNFVSNKRPATDESNSAKPKLLKKNNPIVLG